MLIGLADVQCMREAGLLYISKAQGKNVMIIVKILLQGNCIKGVVGVCGVYHNTSWVSEDLILLRPACWKEL